MTQRFGNPPENESDTHSRGKEHAEPAEIGKPGFFMVLSKLDVTVFAQCDIQTEDQKNKGGNQVRPAEIPDDGLVQKNGPLIQEFRGNHAYTNQNHDDEQGRDKNDIFLHLQRAHEGFTKE
jgi:hypothetical protein